MLRGRNRHGRQDRFREVDIGTRGAFDVTSIEDPFSMLEEVKQFPASVDM